MCGRFTSLYSPELLAASFNVVPPPVVEPRYNIAPTQQVWVVRSDGEHNRLDHMKWGLIPSWAKDPKIGSQFINARSETVHEKPAFRHAIKYNRCIVPASGFFDWVHIGDKKRPTIFTRLMEARWHSPVCGSNGNNRGKKTCWRHSRF